MFINKKKKKKKKKNIILVKIKLLNIFFKKIIYIYI